MSTSESATSNDPVRQRRPRAWITQLVIPTLAAVIGAVLVTALTPLGQNLRELIFPTRAVVTGTATLNGSAAPNATLLLDGGAVGTAGESGSLIIPDVRAGTHVLHLEAFGAMPLDKNFVVTREASVVELGEIELPAVAHLGFYVSLTPQDRSHKIDYRIALWIDADQDTLADIEKVTYALPDPLPAKPVKGKKAARSFCFTKSGTVKINDLFGPGGSFGVARAKITLAGGVLELSALPSDTRPPERCPNIGDLGADSGGSGGGGSGGGGSGGGGSGGSGSGNAGNGTSGGSGSGGDDQSGPKPGDDDPGKPGDGGQEESTNGKPVVISCAVAADGGTYQAGPDASAAVDREVRWVNEGNETMSLDITDDPTDWDSAATGQLAPGASYSFSFRETGVHSYTCMYPSHKISGSLVIKAK